MNRYLFCIRADMSPFKKAVISLDSFYKLETSKLDETTIKVARQINPSFGDKDVHVYNAMYMRTRFDGNCIGPYLINSEMDIDRESLEEHIRTLSELDELESFLEKAKI